MFLCEIESEKDFLGKRRLTIISYMQEVVYGKIRAALTEKSSEM